MNKNTENLIWALCIFIVGIIIGYNIKKCPVITNTVTTIDTVYSSYPLIDTYKVNVPVNKPFFVTIPGKKEKVYVYDTVKIGNDLITFESRDTLKHDGMFVALFDKGNCNGIFERKSIFGGEMKERIINNEITNTVLAPLPFVTLHAGASASFSNRWNAFDVGPATSIVIRQRHIIHYNYGINTSTYNFSLQTKIR